MPQVVLSPDRSVVVVVDLQSSLVPHLLDADRVVNRALFLVKIALLLGVPILATEQNPSRMGETVDSLRSLLPVRFSKMAFDAAGSLEFARALRESGRDQAILLGVETHICISQTAHTLLNWGLEVVVCPDGVGARSLDRHKLGMERLRDAGAVPVHTEAVAYEWLGSADHPQFRDALGIVKAHP